MIGQLFCPRCAAPFETTGPEYRCPVGNMLLSRVMQRGLIAAFIDPGVDELPRPFRVGIGGTWFCPRDRSLMEENAGIIACPECHRSLNRYVIQLVELHPHAPVP